ncbi:MAG: hypothetical protein M3Y37_11330 [Chloroflexota bacterium]|nr:hypothetical protein [Chloroflexota bacterium]
MTPARQEERDDLQSALDRIPKTIERLYDGVLPGYPLRSYQEEPAKAIAGSIQNGEGKQFAVVFARQAGKDELLARLLAWILVTYAIDGGEVVVAAPTMRPQASISRDRLVSRIKALVPDHARTRDGYIVEVGSASVRFLSADPGANARGQTANLLLVANEAQDILADVWDPVFDPMAASTNATTLFMGTPWNKQTLLYRQMAFLEQRGAETGTTLVWRVPWREVAKHVSRYGDRVEARIAQFGAEHPWIKTEYELIELDGEDSLFNPRRIAAMQGTHPRRYAAEPGKRYALLIDVAGEDEAGGTALAFASGRRRDATALTVVEIDAEPGRETVFRTVDRRIWIGSRHTTLRDELAHLAREVWAAERVVIDATGIGAGLASFLEERLGDRSRGRAIPVERFVFSQKSKSELGWNFIGLIDTGRYREYRDEAAPGSPEGQCTAQFWAECKAIEYHTEPGPNRMMSWGASGRGHDDLVMSAALVAQLDGHDWRRRIARGVGD